MNENRKTEMTASKRNYGAMIIVLMLLLVGIVSIQAGNNPVQNHADETELLNNAAPATGSSQLTVWNIIQMTDWLFWPFTIMTAVGLMLITYYVLLEHRDRSRSRRLLQMEIRPNDIRSMLHVMKSEQTNRASRLFNQMISTFNKTNHAEPISNDVNQYLNLERESFETFNRINNFLSDSAGALGLLGTVWGIFMTFHAGKMDGPTILHGMSVALVTTLVGLIISLVLNLGATYVFTLFNDQLKKIAGRAEELRQSLLFLEKRTNSGPERIHEPAPDAPAAKPQIVPKRKKNAADRFEVAF
jgi:biopolymer transport protein ExbB/TolQ